MQLSQSLSAVMAIAAAGGQILRKYGLDFRSVLS
jgi:hypothetical protein